jgi:heme-degrading monooxygenase HmoA
VVVRTALWSGTSAQLDAYTKRALERVRPTWESAPGLLAVHCLLDKERGEALTITVWRNDEAAAATEEQAEESRRQTVEESGVALERTGRWEVVF